VTETQKASPLSKEAAALFRMSNRFGLRALPYRNEGKKGGYTRIDTSAKCWSQPHLQVKTKEPGAALAFLLK